ncbi:hypothetical protein [Cochlodiniinecator piscidefendens]|uniref:hypothetical protein n=1 Tax=Cochlodiniinecator piscidefendens TaxID=2715756 RepID=UPI001409691F|nr:hypothetical protein [Cochlodiniinecator piscidefendens]
MAGKRKKTPIFNVMVVGQSGRWQYEAVLFAASLRASDPDFKGRLFVAEPQPGPKWNDDPRMGKSAREALEMLGAEIIPFDSQHFGSSYPYGNKIEALMALPKGEPFVFFDTDTLITGELSKVPFDFDKPSASMKREGTWPTIELYGPKYTETWKSLYDKFALEFDGSLDKSHPDEYWERYLYFNAGWFFFRCPHEFGTRFAQYATAIRDDRPHALVCQELNPWLDQVALPLVIHSFGGGRHTIPEGLLDGDISCHYRLLPLLYARESDRVVEVLETITEPNKIKKVVKQNEAMKKMIFQKKGQKVRDMFDRDNLPRKEQQMRNQIKRANLWMR